MNLRRLAAKDRQKAVETLTDRLLASPRFGERWGRHWLDKARFADSDGYEKDQATSGCVALSRLGDRGGEQRHAV